MLSKKTFLIVRGGGAMLGSQACTFSQTFAHGLLIAVLLIPHILAHRFTQTLLSLLLADRPRSQTCTCIYKIFTYIYTYIYIYFFTYVYIHTHVGQYVYVCMHIYIYMYTSTYIGILGVYICMHIHIPA